MSARGVAALSWAVVVTVLMGALALAAGRPIVVVVEPAPFDPTAERLRSELELLGIDVTLEREDGQGLADIARSHDAVAAARVMAAPPAIRLWVAPDRLNPPASAPIELTVEGAASDADPGLLALRAIEVLRALLLPRPVEPRADAGLAGDAADAADAATGSEADPAPADAAARPAAPRAPAAADGHRGPSIFAGPAVVVGPGGMPPLFDVAVGARWSPLRRLDLEVLVLAPVAGAVVSAAGGEVRTWLGAAAAGASLDLIDPGRDVFLRAGLGAGAALLIFAGEAAPPFSDAGGTRVSALPYAHVAGGYWLGRRLALRADVLAAVIRPRPVVRIAGRDEAAMDAPAMFLSVGCEVAP